MSTRGIVAVIEHDGWRGFEIQGDAYPDGAGAELLRRLAALGLEATCKRIVSATLFPAMKDKATPASMHLRGDLAWAYMIDPSQRELRVYHEGAVSSPDAPKLFGTWGKVATHTIAADGSCTPPEMAVELPVPWPLLRVDDSWDPREGLTVDAARDQQQSDGEATARLATRRRIERDCKDAKLRVEDFYVRLEAIVVARLLRSPWGDLRPRRVYIERRWTSTSKYWSLSLDGTMLAYPPAGWGRSQEGSLFLDGGEITSLTLFVEPSHEAELDVQPDAVIDDPVVRDILRTAIHGSSWFFQMLDLLRARQLPDGRGEDLERMAQSPRDATDWQVFVHADGRVWAIRPSTKGFQLRLGDPDDDPVFKDRAGTAADLATLIDAQLADGFVRRP